MATTKDRVIISLKRDTKKALEYMAKRDQMPLASRVTLLVEEAVELDEDRILSAIADERLKGKVRWVKDSDKIWK